MIEPIQGEGGVLIPSEGYLREIRRICTKNNVLMIADEIQTGLGRTGKIFACEYENVRPDMVIIGKALGGGFYPVSAVLADEPVMGLFTPGEHGSTFGGNPLGAAVAREAIRVIREEKLVEKSAEMGEYFMAQLMEIPSQHVKEIRGRGLLIGVELKPEAGGARRFCESLMQKGILAKETHEKVIRFAPPLIITKQDIDWAIPRIRETLQMP
jgi:ornithine--oxo-acid transaminase